MGLWEHVLGWGCLGLPPEERLLTFVPASSPLSLPCCKYPGGLEGGKAPLFLKSGGYMGVCSPPFGVVSYALKGAVFVSC